MTAAELLVRELKQRGIDWMATLCGHGLDPLFQAARKAGMRLVDARNEQTAAYLADAYGRLTRRPGVCAVSSGIAQVNRSEEHTSELQSQSNLVCRLLLEKK